MAKGIEFTFEELVILNGMVAGQRLARLTLGSSDETEASKVHSSVLANLQMKLAMAVSDAVDEYKKETKNG